jgi:hypothetical protein
MSTRTVAGEPPLPELLGLEEEEWLAQISAVHTDILALPAAPAPAALHLPEPAGAAICQRVPGAAAAPAAHSA